MHSSEFNAYKTRYRAAIRQVLAEAAPGRLDEAAFPAYSHPNPLINWLFWQRLRVVMDYIQQAAPVERALDFGCGSGVMLPFLAEVSREVTALDVDLAPLEWVQRFIPLAATVRALDANQTSLADLAPHSYDFINALDVLEHVDDLPRTLADLLRLLKPGGQIIISGPTENILYQLGRRLAGPEYSGAYHERGVAEIRADLAKLATVRPIATLYWPMPLFEIFAGQV